jgi:adenine-specific DNA-methyltransferase
MSKYNKFSKEELLALVEKQDNELASKKYGLVWDSERELEQAVLDCEHNVPVLKRVKGKEIKESKDQEDNILIEGDNYHALTVLNYTHQEKIDVIYIDPPYNTGNKDFKYNDKFIDKEDGFRHSKWLNFMEKRLNLAKDLIKDSGSIFISIDDNEVAQLKMLCDKVFGENNFISQITWHRKRGKDNSAKYLSRVHEYVLIYGKDVNKLIFNKIDLSEQTLTQYTNPENDSRGNYRKLALWRRGGQGGSKAFPFTTKEGISVPSRSWLVNEETMRRLDQENKLVVVGEGLYRKLFLSEHEGAIPETIWLDASNTANATDMIKEIFGKSIFDTPKPIELMNRILKISSKKESVILDFMAGSGTTGHAVLELNKEDGGNRKFILCTNNENKICEEVTYPRIQKVIKGYKKYGNGEKVAGLGGNLQYFKAELIKKTNNKDQLRFDLTQKCTEMLCVKENIFNLEIEKEDYKIFSSNKGGKFLCVYYNLYDESFKEFLKEIKKLKGEKKIYVFSIDGKVDRDLFKGIKDFEVEEIPQKIIDIYKQLVKMNIPVKANTIFLDFEKAQKKVLEEKDKDEGARILRIVLEKTIQKITQQNKMSIFKENNKEEKIAILNDNLYNSKVFRKVQWEENKTYLAIGNHASHGEYGEYDLKQVENFYKHIQSLFNDFGI